MRKDRGLEELDSYLENFSGLIKEKLKKSKKVKFLTPDADMGLQWPGLSKNLATKWKLLDIIKRNNMEQLKN